MEGREGCSVKSIDHAQPSPPNQRILQPIERARLQLEQESKEIAAEERALDTFGERVEAIDCKGIQFSSSVINRIREIDGESNPMTQIQTAYRETMLDVAHYDREYGEPLVKHLASEIGLDLAKGICGEANVAFTPQIKTALLNGIEQARDKRRAFKEVLDEEGASLASARQALTDLLEEVNECYRTIQTAPETTPSFDDIERELDTIVTERQDHLHHCSELQHLTNRDLCEYLYGGDDWTYPVLTAAASLRNEIEQPFRQKVEQH